jgi:hypothetical protein
MASVKEDRLEMGMTFRVMGEVHANRDELDPSEIALRRSLRILLDLNSEYEAAKTIVSLTELRLRKDDTPDREQFKNAIATFEKLGAEADLLRARSLMEELEGRGQEGQI